MNVTYLTWAHLSNIVTAQMISNSQVGLGVEVNWNNRNVKINTKVSLYYTEAGPRILSLVDYCFMSLSLQLHPSVIFGIECKPPPEISVVPCNMHHSPGLMFTISSMVGHLKTPYRFLTQSIIHLFSYLFMCCVCI